MLASIVVLNFYDAVGVRYPMESAAPGVERALPVERGYSPH
jgi:hypothetical protein